MKCRDKIFWIITRSFFFIPTSGMRWWFARERQGPAVEPAAGGLTVQVLIVNRMQVQTIEQGVWYPGLQIEKALRLLGETPAVHCGTLSWATVEKRWGWWAAVGSATEQQEQMVCRNHVTSMLIKNWTKEKIKQNQCVWSLAVFRSLLKRIF